MLDVTRLLSVDRPTGVWTAALLQALYRDEVAGRSPRRLTEPGMATWQRFRGRLGARDFIALLFEDAAVVHPVPFDSAALGQQFDPSVLPSDRAEKWLADLPALPESSAVEYLAEQARLLGLPGRFARSELHVVKSHQRVLELPGTGGQMAHHLVTTHPGLTLQDNFVVACQSWQEQTMAGIVALDLGAPRTDFVVAVTLDALRDPENPLRQKTFDFVIGLHPDRGGYFRVEDQLAIWYPNARIVLV